MPAGRRDVRDQVASMLELPGDVVLDVARITIIGSGQMALENHRGLLEFTPEQASVAIPGGRVAVAGSGLIIGSISADAILLQGRIESLRFISE